MVIVIIIIIIIVVMASSTASSLLQAITSCIVVCRCRRRRCQVNFRLVGRYVLIEEGHPVELFPTVGAAEDLRGLVGMRARPDKGTAVAAAVVNAVIGLKELFWSRTENR